MTETPAPPPYQVLPPLSNDEFAALKADIAERGILVPIEVDERGNVLDGHHRLRAWEELRAEGRNPVDYPKILRPGLSEVEKRAHARLLNAARRQLSREQRRALITQALVDAPQRSNRQIAAEVGVDHKTVAAERSRLEGIGEIPQCDRETADGRSYPARRRPPTTYVAARLYETIHPMLDLIPLMTADELDDLTENIKAHGLLMPIVVTEDGTLLDGRCRLIACARTGVEPRVEIYRGDDPLSHVLRLNFMRQSLTPDQRVMIKAKLLEMGAGPAETAATGQTARPEVTR